MKVFCDSSDAHTTGERLFQVVSPLMAKLRCRTHGDGGKSGHVYRHICLCVCLSVLNVLAFEGLDLEGSVQFWSSIFRILKSSSCTNVTGLRSRSQEQKSLCTAPPVNFKCLNLKR